MRNPYKTVETPALHKASWLLYKAAVAARNSIDVSLIRTSKKAEAHWTEIANQLNHAINEAERKTKY